MTTKAHLAAVEAGVLAVIKTESPIGIRRLHYRLSVLGITKNVKAAYRLLSELVTKMRREGRLPYSAIVDNTRDILRPNVFADLAEYHQAVRDGYTKDPWVGIADRVIIKTEKDAIRHLLEPIRDELAVPIAIGRGRASETLCFDLAATALRWLKTISGSVYVYHIGDWDATGWHIAGDEEKRTRHIFGMYGGDQDRLIFNRIGLNEQQVIDLKLPQSLDTKTGDASAATWPGVNGDRSKAYEVDAVDPAIIRQWAEDAVMQHITDADYDARDQLQADDQLVIDSWPVSL